jgi:hypothetical protein
MAQDNTRREWQAHCVTWEGERIEWRGLRHRQAKWRYDFLRSGMRWQGKELRACGYSLEREAIA